MVKKHGTREEVWDGKAQMTKGGLTKEDLELRQTKGGKRTFVSKNASESAKKNNVCSFVKKAPAPAPKKKGTSTEIFSAPVVVESTPVERGKIRRVVQRATAG